MIPMLLTTPTLATKLQINLSYNFILKRLMRGGKLPSGKPRPQIESPKKINNNSPENSIINPAQNFNKLTEQEAKDAITNLDSKAMELHKDFSPQSLPSQQLQNSPAALAHKKLSPVTPLSSEKINPNTLPGYHDLKSALFSSDNHTISSDEISSTTDLTPEEKEINLPTISNKTFTTSLSKKTDLSTVTRERMCKELEKRELITDDPGNITKMKGQDKEIHSIGLVKSGYKITSLGRAYIEQEQRKSNKTINAELQEVKPQEIKTDKDNKTNEIKISGNILEKLIIIIPPDPDPECLIEDGKHKHMLLIVDDNNNQYFLGYLTTKVGSLTISSKTFKVFQQELEDAAKEKNSQNVDGKEQKNTDVVITKEKVKKTQQILQSKNPEKIDKPTIRLEGDKEYIKSLSPEESRVLESQIRETLKEPVIIFDNKGVTFKSAFQICLEHDKIAENIKKHTENPYLKGEKLKHPLTGEQIKINEQQNKMQKDKTKIKSINKDDTKTINND